MAKQGQDCLEADEQFKLSNVNLPKVKVFTGRKRKFIPAESIFYSSKFNTIS